MEKEIDWEKAHREIQSYVAGLVSKAEGVVNENPYLLQAFGDFMDVNHEKVDPMLEKIWEHNLMWLLHHKFMEKANALKYDLPDFRKQLDELTNIMKLIAQTVDLALLPRGIRESVEDWAKRYKEHFGKKK